MAIDPGVGQKVIAKVISVKGECHAGHQEGDTFEISCHNPGGLCGFFYHNVFPSLMTFQFGAQLPWWGRGGDMIRLQCPDNLNLVTLELRRSERDALEGPA